MGSIAYFEQLNKVCNAFQKTKHRKKYLISKGFSVPEIIKILSLDKDTF